ncbi:MAG: biosynthetic-type acetolactate synthase large subunit [Pseudoruminococcus massiliensis]
MELTGSEILVQCLREQGVDTVFGYPGGCILNVYDALYKHSDEITHILTSHEQGASHAADGYARATGKVGVCMATSGPGATNLVTGIATAYMDSIPIVAITGQVRSDLIGRDVFQEADITGACEPFIKHSYLVKDTNDLARIFKEAFHIATTGRPGPVLIDVPIDIQQNKISGFEYPEDVDIIGYKPSVKGHPIQIKRALELIAESKRPVICSGGGVLSSGSKPIFAEFADKTGIPVVSTMMGIGVMPSDNKQYLGMLGSFGTVRANRALLETDLLILCGARVGDRAVAAPHQVAERAKVIHIDIDPAEIGKNIQTTVPIVGDMKNVITVMRDKINYHISNEWKNEFMSWQEPEIKPIEGFVEPRTFISRLSEMLRHKAILVADVGQNQIWCANNFKISDGRFLTTGGMGTMGYSLPAALGAKLARPERDVFVVCGDGSFQMSMSELAVAVQSNINVKIIIMQNGRLGMVREIQDKLYGSRYAATILNDSPDFAKLAEAYGIKAYVATTNKEAENAVAEMLESDKPNVLICQVSPETPSR